MASTSIEDACDEFACEPPNKSADPTPDDPLNWANFDCGESGDPIGSSPNKSADEIAFAFLYFSPSTDFGDEYEDDDLKWRHNYVTNYVIKSNACQKGTKLPVWNSLIIRS